MKTYIIKVKFDEHDDRYVARDSVGIYFAITSEYALRLSKSGLEEFRSNAKDILYYRLRAAFPNETYKLIVCELEYSEKEEF